MITRLREFIPSDIPAVQELLREQNERDGTSYTVPNLFDGNGSLLRNIVLALVAVTSDGEVKQAHVWEKTIEQMTIGIDPEVTVCSMREQDAVFFMLRERGYRDFHILVPPERAPQMEHGLRRIYGMSATGLQHFYRLLDPEENASLLNFYEKKAEV